MKKITTHVLDTGRGKPAAGLAVGLYWFEGGKWEEAGSGITNGDGRIMDWAHGVGGQGADDSGNDDREPDRVVRPAQIYKIRFETGAYFAGLGVVTFYPFVEVQFTVGSDGHYHIPLLLSPFGYSTYRGS